MAISIGLLDFPSVVLLSEATAGQRGELIKKIIDFNRDSESFEAETAALRGVPEADWSSSNDAAASRLRSTKLELIKREIAIRDAIDDHYDALVRGDLGTAVDALHAEHERAK